MISFSVIPNSSKTSFSVGISKKNVVQNGYASSISAPSPIQSSLFEPYNNFTYTLPDIVPEIRLFFIFIELIFSTSQYSTSVFVDSISKSLYASFKNAC